MKRLGLFRHAKSDWDDLTLRDFDRGLNDRGRLGAAIMGRHIREQGIAWDLALASPAERVRRSLEASGLALPIRWDEQAYLASSSALLDILRAIEGEPESILLVGHNPGLQDLIFDLVDSPQDNPLVAAAAQKYPTGSFAVLELGIDKWRDCAPGCGRLVHFTRPRDLDPRLGPESAGSVAMNP